MYSLLDKLVITRNPVLLSIMLPLIVSQEYRPSSAGTLGWAVMVLFSREYEYPKNGAGTKLSDFHGMKPNSL